MKRVVCGAVVGGMIVMAAGAWVMGLDSPPAGMAPATQGIGETGAKLMLGKIAPEIEATGLKGGAVKLSDFAGKVVVLQFGSLSEPVFRLRVPEVEKLAAKYAGKVVFLTVYQRESHPADGDALDVNVEAGYSVTKPNSFEERVKLAQQTVERLKIEKQKVVVDAWSNASSGKYGAYPNGTFVIDAAGNLQAGYPWMDPAKVQGAVDALLAGKVVPAEFKGKTHKSVPAQADLGQVPGDAGPGGKFVATLDRLKLTVKQKEAVYPALADYVEAARNVREKAGGSGVEADEFRALLEKMQAAKTKLTQAVKENLSEEDAKKVMEVLDRRGPERKLN